MGSWLSLDGCSAFWAGVWAALGEGPPEGVDDEGESHLRDLTRCVDCSVRGASSGLGLDLSGHGLPPVTVSGQLSGLAPEWQPGELAESDKKAGGSQAATISRSGPANPSPVVCGL